MGANKSDQKSSFWQTVPGIISAIAALMTAIGGCILLFYTMGIIRIPSSATATPPSTSVTIILQGPTSTPVASTTIPPTIVIPDPEAFLRLYLNELVQKRDYSDLWNKYLTPGFQAKDSPQGFTQYVNNWSNVQKININSITITRQSDTSASAEININYRIQSGSLITNKILDWDLTYNTALSTWQLDVH